MSGPAPPPQGPETPGVPGAPSVPPVDRSAALAHGAPGIPGNFVFWLLGAVFALALGGLVAERLFSAVGLDSTSTLTTTTTTVPPAPGSTATGPPAATRSLHAPLAAFMGMSTGPAHAAPAFTLDDLSGRATAVPAPPRVVVLTFFDATCNDICPVLAAEIEQADADLGARAAQVEFVTVNTDPAALAPSAAAPVLGTGLGALPNWRMVTGPLSTLDAVWKDYGVSISVATQTGRVAHNDVMAFIDSRGALRARATPFADESAAGTYSLPAAVVTRWGRGIASTAEGMMGR